MAEFLSPDKLEALKKESPEIQAQVLDKYFPTLKQETPDIQNQVRQKYGLSPITVEPKEQPGFLSRLGTDLEKRAKNVSDAYTPTQTELSGEPSKSLGETLIRSPFRALRLIGQSAGLVGDLGGEILSSITPDAVKNKLSEGVQHVMSQPGNQNFVQGVSQAAEAAKEKSPELYNAAGDVANIASLVYGSKLGNKTAPKPAPESITAFTDMKSWPEKYGSKFPWSPSVDKEIDNVVSKTVEKAIKPSVVGQNTSTAMTSYMDKAKNAVKTIVANKDDLILTNEFGDKVDGLPKTLKQFSQAIDQTKSKVFQQYDTLQKMAGQSGGKVSLAPIADQLDVVADSKVLKDNSPGLAQYASDMAARYRARGAYTTQEAQDTIKHFNTSLDAFYKNPTYDTASKAYIDSMIVNQFRTSLDKVIDSATGGGYQELKKTYGSLKAIEKDVSRRAIIDARKNAKGLIDFSDIFSGSTAVHGILTMNPAVVGEAAAAKGISNLYRRLNDPNRIVKGMFDDVEKLLAKKQGEMGITGKAVKATIGGAKQMAPATAINVVGNNRPFSMEDVARINGVQNGQDKATQIKDFMFGGGK